MGPVKGAFWEHRLVKFEIVIHIFEACTFMKTHTLFSRMLTKWIERNSSKKNNNNLACEHFFSYQKLLRLGHLVKYDDG